MSLIIVSAVEFEILETVKVLKNLNINFKTFQCGIGPINAAHSCHELRKIITDHDVIFIGTCGSFHNFDRVQLITSNYTEWLPACQRQNLSWPIEGVHLPIKMDISSSLAKSLPVKKVICCPNISKNNLLPKEYKSYEYVENLELYSISSTLINYSRSLTCILGITNFIGKNARVEWKDNFKEASLLTARFIEDNIETR